MSPGIGGGAAKTGVLGPATAIGGPLGADSGGSDGAVLVPGCGCAAPAGPASQAAGGLFMVPELLETQKKKRVIKTKNM